MEADFSGWASKAGLRCSDGVTIMPGAFKAQNKEQVPLVWQHGHNNVENVLGHAILEDRPDGTYTYAFFNDTPKAVHARTLVEHRDITALSIWANELIKRGENVHHGSIREVSLVLAGANPGARIEHVSLRHSNGEVDELDDEVIIFTGLPIEHEQLAHAEGDDDEEKKADESEEDGETLQDIYEAMSDKEKDVVHYMVGVAMQAAGAEGDDDDEEVKQDNVGENDESTLAHNNSDKEGSDMGTSRNVFEQDGTADAGASPAHISHSDLQGIFADATKSGSLKQAVEGYAIAHGITNIDVLFPEARTLTTTPEWDKRETEWVGIVLGGVRKSPFSRVKTWTADITFEEARAKGYVKGDMKKEEWFSIAFRETGPQTIYKKQKLDRDDIIDITSFDVVVWMKGEMRLMLNEELARAILVSDGREISDPDKIKEDKIRPIATDDPYYTTQLGVVIDDADPDYEAAHDAIIRARQYYKGTGTPDLFTTETFITESLLVRDSLGRKVYRDVAELATTLRVGRIVAVEVLNEYPDTIGIIVNLGDYVVGTDRGGEVTMFDDFDIDFNQYKYLIETRCSGALTKPATAIHVHKTATGSTAVTAVAPAWDRDAYTVTIPTVAGVVYRNAAGAVLANASVVTLTAGETLQVQAWPDATHHLNPGKTRWSYLRPPA